MKKCKTCNKEKELLCFSKQSKAADGLQPKCKECTRTYHKQYAIDKRAERLIYSRKWRAANPEKVKAQTDRAYERTGKTRKVYNTLSQDGKKICSQCREQKDVSFFSKQARRPDGLRGHCKSCDKLRRSDYYKKNYQSIIKPRQQANRENTNKRRNKWREDNHETYKKRNKEDAIKAKERLSDGYVKDRMKYCNIPLTPETIEIKRELIKLHELLKTK